MGIAIPSLNQSRYVGQMLSSVRDLDIPFEAVIRDAGSTDGTLEVIRSKVGDDDRFLLEVARGEGQAAAINHMWQRLLARHQLVTWMNTDDVYHVRPYARLLRELARRDDGTVMMFGDFQRIDALGRVIDTTRRPQRVYRSQLVHYHTNLVPGVGMAIRSDAVGRVGLLDESLRFAFDYELWLRLSEIGAIRKHDEVVASFRWHPDAKTAGQPTWSRDEQERIAERERGPGHLPFSMLWRLVARTNRTLGRW